MVTAGEGEISAFPGFFALSGNIYRVMIMGRLKMKNLAIKGLLSLAVLAALGNAPKVKAGEMQLPLQQGQYLREDVQYPGTGKKSFPPESFSFDAQGLSYPGCHCFETIQVRNRGKVYYLTQRCVLKGEDVLKMNLTVLIKNKTSFLLIDDAGEQGGREKKETRYYYHGNLNNP